MSDYESKVKVSVDDSELDKAEQKINNLNGKKINIKVGAQQANGQVQTVQKTIKSAHSESKSLSATLKNMTIGTGVYKVIGMIASTAKDAVSAVKELDSSIVDLQNATNYSYADTRNLVSGYTELGKEIGATTTEVASGADNWLRQGKSIAETNTLLKDSMVLSKVAKLDSEESTKYLTAISKGYKVAVDDVSSINDSLTSIDMAAAVDAGGLAEATSRVAASAELAGVKLNRLLGYAAVMGESSQEGMSVIGNSLKTIFARMSSIKAGKLELVDENGTVETLSDVETVLTNIGIPLRDSANEFRNFDEVLDDTAKKWKTLSSVQRAAVSQAFAGTRQANRFQLLMENYDKALEYQKIADNSVGTAQKKFEENYLNSIEAKQKSLQASFEALATNTISRDMYTGVLEATQALVEFADKSGLAKTALAGLATGVTLKGFTALASSIVQASSKMNNFKQALDLVKVGNLGTNEVDKLGTLITGLSQSQQKAVLSSKALTDQQRIQALMVTGMSQAEAQAAVSTMGLSTAQSTATATTTTLSGVLKGLFATIASNPLLMFSTVVMGTVTAYQALQAADKKFGLSYDSSLNLVKESVTAYEESRQELDGLNNELETTKSRIAELQGLEESGKITIAEEAELEKLKQQNELLETQIQIQQRLAESKSKETAEQAQKTLTQGEQSVAQQVAQNVPGGKRTYQGMVDNVNVIDAVNENVSAIKKYEKKIKSLQKVQAGYDPKSKEWQQASKDIEKYNDAIDKLNSDLNIKSADLKTLLSAFSLNGEGITALAGYEEEFNAVKEALNSINNIDLSPAEKKLKSIDDFFSGSKNNFIKDNLLEAVKAGGKASDALELLGVNLKDAGIDADTLNRYFQEMANSASEAAEETSKINNSLTMSDIKSAFESENAGDDYVSLNDYMQKAKELFDQGLTGTDDFKSVAEMLSYNIDSTTESFKQNYDKLQRYFTEDGDGNLTGQGIQNFLTDLQSLGKGYATWNDEAGKWDINMSNTAQAAKELGVSVGVFEAILGRIKDYDNIGEFDFKSALKDFAEAKSSLEGLQAIYDDMEEGDRKTALGEKLKEWSPLIEQAEDDLASLPDEVVTKLKFEFDLESLRQQMEEFDKQWENGNRSQEVGANRIASRESYRETRESQTGYNENTDASYAESYAKIESLRAQFDTAKTDEARQDIQDSISAVMDLQNAFQDAFAEGNAVDWNSFLQSDEAKGIIDGLDTDIKNMLDIPTHKQLEIGVGFTKDRVEQELAELTAGSTIEFTAELDGVERQVTAIKNEDGTITYTADVNGESVEVLLNQDGSVYYASAGQEPPKEGLAGVFYNWLGQDKANDGTAGVDYKKTGQEAPADKTAGVWYKIMGVIGNIKNFITGGDNLSGTAHVGGTAHASGTLEDDSWIKPQWRTKKDEVSLVGEEAPEIVATREGTWYTVGDKGAEFTHIPKGSVVFNGQQTKELLTKGHIRGRGRSLLGGTSYLGSSSGGFSFSGGASTYNGASGKTTAKASSSKATTETNEEAEKTAEIFDWIETLLDRIQRAISNLDKVASATYKSWTERNKALSEQIGTVGKEISVQQQAYDQYIQKAESYGLDDTLAKKVRDGLINIEEISDETLKEQIKNYKEWYEKALDCQDAIIDLRDELAKLAQTKFDNVSQEFKSALLIIEHRIEMLEGVVNKIEAEGYLISDSLYAQLIENEKEHISSLQDEYVSLQQTMREAMAAGNIQEGSEQWSEMVSEINDVEKAILDANTALVEYNNSLRELEWERFDREQEMLSQIQAESDFLMDLMGSNKMYNDDSSITAEGQATLGLHAVNYNAYMAQADDYAEQIRKINEEIANDPSNLTLLERRQDLLDSQREMIKSAEDEKQAMIDLVSDGYDALLSYMDKIIDKRVQLLQSAKDLYDYEKRVSEYTKEISQLQKQLSSYQGDNSEEAKATIQQIKVNLEEAKMNLDETEYDKYISDQEQLLNDLRDETEEWINQRMDDRDWLLQQVIDYTNANADDIGNTIREQADSVGYTISDAINSIWSPNGTYTQVVAGYVKDFTSLFTTTNNALADIKRYMAKMVGESDTKAEEQMKEASNPTKAPETPKPETPKQPQQPATPTGDGVPKVGDEAIYATGNYYYSSDGESPLGNQNRGGRVYITKVNSASWATKPYHISTGNTLGNGDLGWVSLDQLIGYSKGGLVTDTGLAMLHGSKNEPELVLNSQDTKNFIDLKDSLSKVRMKASNGLAVDTSNPFSNLVASNQTMNYLKNLHVLPEGAVVVNDNKQVDVSIGDIQMYGVNDPEQFASQLIEIMQSNKRIEKIVQEMTLGAMLGRNSMSKYRY